MAKYEAALQGLNSAQRKAVETIDGPVLVIAGPGTGKTQLLTTRIAHILATTDTLPQNILCLTFTDSAAQTMRERLSSMIGQGAYNVTISTYHAFGSDIIRRFPDYFNEQAELEPADNLTIDRIFRQIINSLPYSNPLKYSDAYLNDIKSLVSDAKRALLTPADLKKAAAENLQFTQQANPVIRQSLDGIARIDKKAIPKFAQLAQKITPKSTAEKWRPLAQQFLSELQEAVAAAEESGKTTTLTAWKNAWLAKDEGGNFIADGTKANQKIIAAADVYEQYLYELKTRGLFDYDDMILRAVHALETNDDLKFTLQEQYQYILLDEFQDTNEAQLRIVQLLTDNPINEGRPNVLAVGDDDQAIYAFQGANYSHMLQFNAMYKDVVAVPLTENYRSHPGVLHAARGIAEQIEERLHHHFPAIEKTLTAAARNLPKEAAIERREAQSDVMQYAWVTRRIQELIEQGIEPSEIAVLAPKHRHLEPLVPFLTQEDIPVRYEKRENVLDDPAINQLLRMTELTLALAEGKHTAANALWPQVLSFGFWELPTSVIWRLSWRTMDEHEDWTDELLKDEGLKPVALFFIRLSQLAGTETLETMLDYLIGTYPLNLNEPGLAAYKSPYYEHYFGELTEVASTAEEEPETGKLNADFWSLLTNLIVLRARLREYRGDGEARLTLGDFVEFVKAHRDAELKILNTNPYASGTDAVQLMTAYKAKGMEFKAVFILAVNDEAWGGKARTQTTRISLPQNLQYIRYAGATEDERLRLFYVAITRAKHQLYLVNFTQNYAGKNMTRLKYLNETPDEAGKMISPLLPQGKQEVLPAEDGVPEPTTELAAYWQQRHEAALQSADMQALLQDRLKTFQLSATHISDFVDFVHCGPQSFFLLTILRFPQAPRAELQFGNAMHETLEWIHNDTKKTGKIPAEAATHKALAQRLEAKRMSEHDYKLFLERGKEALSAYLKQRSHTISPENIVEYNFRHEGVFIGDAHLGGKIDKLIINKQTKEIVIVDYKTGRSHNKWSREYNLHKNRQQLYFYKALLEGSHTFAGHKVTGAYLEFVEPDESGKIQELHLSIDETEYAKTKHLAAAVWRRITTLDLPDTTIYTQDLTGIETFESDLTA
ncbi:MAG TPA: ATP-dependent DNA helicase [Candidatus Saccharimonadales bacterium]